MPPKKSQKQKGIKNGKIVLKSTLTPLQKKAIERLSQRINLNGFRWQVVNGMFTQCQVKSILQATQQLNINHLTLNNNKHSNIINDLCIFRPYHKLLNLILRQNLIESIQQITYIDAPLLWRIDFGQNLICNMKTFRKMHCPNLVMFRIGANKIVDLGQLEYCYSPILMQITTQSNELLTDIGPIIKLQASQFKQVYSYNSGIIAPKKLLKILDKRFGQQLVVHI